MSLRQLLSSLARKEDVTNVPDKKAELFTRIKEVIDRLDELPNINSDFRNDIDLLLVSVLDLADTLSAPYYSIDEVLHSINISLACLNRTLDYAKVARPRAKGYGIANLTLRSLVPGYFYTSKAEADAMVEQLKALGSIGVYNVVEVDLVSSYVHQPVQSLVEAARRTSPPPIPHLNTEPLSPKG